MREARAQAPPGTMLVGVIGSPIAHSLSPFLHETAFAALGLGDTWRSFAFEIAPGAAAAALDEMREAEVAGLSVTMPHKADVAALVDDCSGVARDLDAVNCVVKRGGSLYGDNTDGEGFVASLSRAAWVRRRRATLPRGGRGRGGTGSGARAGRRRGGTGDRRQPDARAGDPGRRARRAGWATSWRPTTHWRWPEPSGRRT